MSNKKENILLEVRHLSQHFGKGDSLVKAVDDISFHIYEGEVFGLVGESGSGKSTTGRSIIGLYPTTDGEIYYQGRLINRGLSKSDRKSLTRQMQMIFQDPYASLNPRMTVSDLIGEGYDIHGLYKNKKERTAKIIDLLEQVGLNSEHINRYAHEFSGGQRQRIGIARALAMDPKFIIADEPISALDVSIQAQVVNLLLDFKQEKSLTYLFIAHDLSMVKYISDRIAVMYQGKIVELASADQIYREAVHPYTKSLLSAIPQPDPLSESLRVRQIYQPESVSDPLVYHEVSPGHKVLASDKQLDKWLK